MINPLLEHLAPNFAELERVLKGEQEPRRVHLVELSIDQEVLQAIAERYLGEPWVDGRSSLFPGRDSPGDRLQSPLRQPGGRAGWGGRGQR